MNIQGKIVQQKGMLEFCVKMGDSLGISSHGEKLDKLNRLEALFSTFKTYGLKKHDWLDMRGIAVEFGYCDNALTKRGLLADKE